MWYNLNDLLSKNRIFSFVLSSRGGGKTFSAQEKCFKDFINKGTKFLWVRRYESEIKEIKSSFASNDLKGKFEGDITIKGNSVLYDGNECGQLKALSTSMRVKSKDFSGYDKIIFDEFIIDKGSIKYIKNECELFLELYESVARLRENVRAIFIANSISIVNPYFTYFKIKPDASKRFTMNEHIVIEYFLSDEYINKKKNTRFGKLISSTKYGSYAIENKFLRDNNSLVTEDAKHKTSYFITLVYGGKKYAIWRYKIDKKDHLYVDDKLDENCKRIIALTKDDLNESYKFKADDTYRQHLNIIKFYFNDAAILFSSLEIKNNFFEILNLI